MRRIEKVQQTLENTPQNAFTAKDVADALGISRANASSDLNQLVKSGKVAKSNGRPVTFQWTASQSQPEKEDPYQCLIGHDGSLQNICEQSKAAILYPPNGLHTMILGKSGTGKTLLAKVMHDFAIHSGKLHEDSPYISLNCSDYSNNPQMLVSLLFGHEKGAFTGADQSKEGLIKQAEGGILFLDEIHRLPPTGQEMLFSIMDQGIYRKMGGEHPENIDKILIIGATTEDPKAALLDTFMRRIPIVLRMPSLESRPIKERIDLIKALFQAEADKLNCPIEVKSDVLKSLLSHNEEGNIGKLKSALQYACAKGFLNKTVLNSSKILVDQSCLPENLRHLPLMENNIKIHDSTIFIAPASLPISNFEEEKNGRWYRELDDEIAHLMDLGYTKDQALITLSEKLDLNYRYDQSKIYQNQFKKLHAIVPANVITVIESLIQNLSKHPEYHIQPQLLSPLSLFIGEVINREVSNEQRLNFDFHISKISQEEKSFAMALSDEIGRLVGIRVSKNQTNFLASLIHSVNLASEQDARIPIIILAHGKHTATSMSNVINSIFGEKVTVGFDFLLDEAHKDFFNEVAKYCLRINNEKGILFLVDMGSLVNIGKKITELTGIKTATIDFVSPPLILEAVNKHYVITQLEELAESTAKAFRYQDLRISQPQQKDREESSRPNLDLSLSMPSLLKYYVDFLDLDELASIFTNCIRSIEREVGEPLKDNAIIIFVSHLSRLIEKLVINEPLVMEIENLSIQSERQRELFFTVKKSIGKIDEHYKITIPDREIIFLTEILFKEQF